MRSRISRLLGSTFALILLIPLTMIIVRGATYSIPGADPSRQDALTEAPTGFSTPLGNGALFNGNNQEDVCPTNGGVFPEDITACTSNGFPEPPGDSFILDKSIFEGQETFADGLGPVYNEKSCVNCHQGPVSGGSSHITELRVGNIISGVFKNPTVHINYGLDTIPDPNGQNQPRSLINALAICPDAEEVTPDEVVTGTNPQQTLRTSLNLLGDGFVESIADSTIIGIHNQQCSNTTFGICGEYIQVAVLESTTGATAVGRFGWKDEHASLLSFASDAYLNEMGITNHLPPNNKDITHICKVTSDPEDDTANPPGSGLFDVNHFAIFMRALLAPPPEDQEDIDATGQGPSIQNGKSLFTGIGCSQCHVDKIATAAPGTAVDGGAFIVPAALGDKIIHPYSDFLLHNIGTGDGIVQNGPQDTAFKMRTAPLWGVHTRSRFLHQGLVLTLRQAITTHAGEASQVISNYNQLSPTQKQDLINFLNSL